MKTKIRFIFHTPKGEFRLWPPRFIGNAIVIWTGFLALFYSWKLLKYSFSHEELWLPDEDGCFYCSCSCYDKDEDCAECYIAGKIWLGQCFSSTTRGGAKGVRFASAAEVLKHPERWYYIEVEVDSERLDVVVAEAKRLIGKKYDFLALFGFFNPFPIQNKKRWYCSEIMDWAKVMLRIHRKREARVSPRRAAYLLARKYGEPKKLKG